MHRSFSAARTHRHIEAPKQEHIRKEKQQKLQIGGMLNAQLFKWNACAFFFVHCVAQCSSGVHFNGGCNENGKFCSRFHVIQRFANYFLMLQIMINLEHTFNYIHSHGCAANIYGCEVPPKGALIHEYTTPTALSTRSFFWSEARFAFALYLLENCRWQQRRRRRRRRHWYFTNATQRINSNIIFINNEWFLYPRTEQHRLEVNCKLHAAITMTWFLIYDFRCRVVCVLETAWLLTNNWLVGQTLKRFKTAKWNRWSDLHRRRFLYATKRGIPRPTASPLKWRENQIWTISCLCG